MKYDLFVEIISEHETINKGNRLRKRAYPMLDISAPLLSDNQFKYFPLHVASKSALAPIIVEEAASSAPVTASSTTPFVIVTNNTMIPDTTLHTFLTPCNIEKPEEL